MTMMPITGNTLTLTSFVEVVRGGEAVDLEPQARERMNASYRWVLAASRGEVCDDQGVSLPVYGVNTGYGSLARVRIAGDKISELSFNLIRSHAAGVGARVGDDAVRGMMLLRANALAKGASGCRPGLVDSLLNMLNAGVVPEIPSQGSCGSSGDLAPLSHLALVVFRGPEADDPKESGWAWLRGERLSGTEVMRRAGIERLIPGPKEGLAMNNGAQLTTSIAALAVWDAQRLTLASETAAAMSFEAIRGVTRAIHPGVHELRPYPGAIRCAANLRALMAGSTLTDSQPGKLQDAYSIRCTPQVLGAVRDGIQYAGQQVSIELNAATDNPLILLDGDGPNKAYSAGLFHGEPVGMAADHLKVAVSELAALAERRIFRLTTGSLSSRLPPLLAGSAGLGLMAPQTTAAALVSENRSLAYPSSVDSLPTCEDQEDLVAMSTTAARRAAEVVKNARHVVAIEWLCAARALWVRLDQDPTVTLGVGTAAALASVERVLGGRGGEVPSEDMAALSAALHDGGLMAPVLAAVSELTEGCNG
jgi:histidine ammonia-lyase